MPELRGERVVLVPLADDDAKVLREIHLEPEVLAWWGRPEEGFPLTDDPDATRFTIRHGGEAVGMIQYGEEKEPEYRHAWIDLFLAPAWTGRGLGTDALVTLVRHLQEARGHHRITIDPALGNAAAVRSYEKAGFRRVGVTRRSWRDPGGTWRDSVLMELVVEPREGGGA